ncbi:MAG: efflux RND transporter periplasmic adaptor subunit [Thiothrix sp.]|uniref:efflux RND transporter periplasmic adaptor subunit n=1 Tax=Thiothrix sp. TaxID=1032 RepID=UPI00261F39F2|nr:efflux RND transporter periplasmic adaptor subunit [Thiothrix sp.]MDD5392599.1 efflux RND transporter periplasmic adaptor subunit [Thiothrix sp.]
MKRILLLALLASLAACKESEAPAAPIRPAQVWTVTDQTTASNVSYSGEIKARFEADLSFRVSGKIMAREAEAGDSVKAGQVLAHLDTTDLNLNTQAAQAAARAALSDQATAKAELARNRELFQKNFISKAALEAYINRYNAAESSAKAATAQFDLAQNQSGYSDLKADKDGVITTFSAESGQVVAAGQPVAHIAYDGEREAYIRIGENTAKTLTAGTLVNIKLWSQPDTAFQGKVREISPATDVTRSFLVKISLLNPPEGVRLGATADISLPAARTQETNWLPASALFQQSKQAAVWVMGADHQVHTQAVNVIAYGEDGVIVSGLQAGAQVIAAGIHKLSEGQTITPIPYDGKAGS